MTWRLIGPGSVLTPAGVLPDGGVLLEGERIKRIAPFAELREAHPEAALLEADGGILLPGLIDAFTHATAPLWRAFEPRTGPLPRGLRDWHERVKDPLENELTAHDVALAAKLTFAEAARAGVTSLMVHHASPAAVEGCLDIVAEAAQAVGVRAVLGVALDERYGSERAQAALAEAQRFAAAASTTADSPDGGHLRNCFALATAHAVGETSTERLRTLGFVTGEAGALLAPLAEDPHDLELVRRERGAELLDWLEAQGLLAAHLIAVGGAELSTAELDRLAQVGAAIVHTPRANSQRGARRAPLEAFRAQGMLVGLGTAGSGPDLFAEVREAARQLRDRYGGVSTGVEESFDALFTGNPTLLARLWEDPPGALVKGAPADLAVLVPQVKLEAEAVPGYVVHHATAAQVRHTVCAGKVIVENGSVAGLDETELREQAAQRISELWQPTHS